MYTIKRIDSFGSSFIYRDIPTKKHAIIMLDKIISELPTAINKETAKKQYKIIKQSN